MILQPTPYLKVLQEIQLFLVKRRQRRICWRFLSSCKHHFPFTLKINLYTYCLLWYLKSLMSIYSKKKCEEPGKEHLLFASSPRSPWSQGKCKACLSSCCALVWAVVLPNPLKEDRLNLCPFTGFFLNSLWRGDAEEVEHLPTVHIRVKSSRHLKVFPSLRTET